MSFVWLPLALFHIQVSTLKPGKPYGDSCGGGEVPLFHVQLNSTTYSLGEGNRELYLIFMGLRVYRH